MRLNRRDTESGGRGLATPAQLVAAASRVFADFGYRGATVRDICRQAGANVAAVNYHFGGKEGLYAEVLRCGLRRALAPFPAGDPGPERGGTAKERLRAFVRSLRGRLLATGPDGCHGRLMMREMVDPTPALDTVVATEIRGMTEYLEGLVAELVGSTAGPERVAMAAASVVSQVVFYHHCRQVIPRAFPSLVGPMDDVEGLADHIVRFSLEGLAGAASASESASTPASAPASESGSESEGRTRRIPVGSARRSEGGVEVVGPRRRGVRAAARKAKSL